MSIELKNLNFSYNKNRVLNNVNLKINEGETVALLGPNGTGKTTLFKCLLSFLDYESGYVFIDGQDIKTLSRKELSKKIAYIPQSFNPVFGHTVLDCVLMGYAGILGIFERPSDKQVDHALRILKELKIEHLAYKSCTKISGGERNLMLIARALVQGARIIVMDEGTANLDLANIKKVMSIIEKLALSGYTILFSTHDPNLAVHYSKRIILLKNGQVFADINPSNLSEKTLQSVYDTEIETVMGFRVKL